MDLSVLHKGLTFLLFKYSTLEKATDCFNETNKLGHGGFGEIFKARVLYIGFNFFIQKRKTENF